MRSYQDKEFWGTTGHPRAGKLPKRPFDEYFYNNLYFDTGGFCGNVNAVKAALLEMKPSQVLFGTDYPQEIRSGQLIADYLKQISTLGLPEEDLSRMLSGNGKELLGL